MRCLSTRTTPEGWKRRRYESATGVRHTTIEVPIELWTRLNTVGRQRDRAAQFLRTQERESRKRQALLLAAAGRAPKDIAKAVGVSRRTAERWVYA